VTKNLGVAIGMALKSANRPTISQTNTKAHPREESGSY